MLSHVQAGFQASNLEHLIEGKVTYSSLETKTIDDYNVKLLKSENQILKKNSRLPFVGSDDAENHDINNGRWKKNFTQKLRERYAISKRWQTFLDPNPNVNLSCYNWRKKNTLSQPVNNQELVVSDESPGCHLDQIYEIKKNKITNEIGKMCEKLEKDYQCHLEDVDNQKADQSSHVFFPKNIPKPPKEDIVQELKNKKAALYLEFEENMKGIENARNEVYKILTYYRGVLQVCGDKERTLEANKLFYLSNAEFKQWIEREEIMDMHDFMNP